MNKIDSREPVRRWYEAWNRKDMSVSAETVAPDVVVHIEGAPDIVGIDAYRQFVTMFWEAFTDLDLTIEQLVSETDMVFIRSRSRATFSGEFQGLPPTGEQVDWRNHNLYRVADGKWVEAWAMPDSLNMMRQLGAIPA